MKPIGSLKPIGSFLPRILERISNVQHRKTDPKEDGCTNQTPGPGNPGAVSPADPAHLAAVARHLAATRAALGAGLFPGQKPARSAGATFAELRAAKERALARQSEPPLENTGIEVGEIIAWRGWRIDGERLRSLYMPHTWYPGGVMTGDPSISHGEASQPAGIYAMKHKATARVTAAAQCGWFPGLTDDNPEPFVIGQVEIWGEVIEHEYGYRATFAAIHSLDEIFDFLLRPERRAKLDALRQIYGVEAP